MRQPAWAQARVVVTGCTGFLGRHLVAELQGQGAQVVGLVRAPQDKQGSLPPKYVLPPLRDIANPEELATAIDEADVIFHLAAASIRGSAPQALLDQANVDLTRRILQAVANAAASPPLVFASSERVYAPGGALPHSESSALGPTDAYARSKALAEEGIRSACAEEGLRAAILRCTGVYGPDDPNSSRLVPSILAALAEKSVLRLRSDGTARRDFLYVEDAVAAFLAVAARMREADAACCEVYNVGSGRPMATRDLAAMALELAQEPHLGLEFGALRDDSSWLDCTRLKQDTGWEAATDLREGLRRTWKALVAEADHADRQRW